MNPGIKINGLKHDEFIFTIAFSLVVNNCIYYQTSNRPMIVYNMRTSKWNKYSISTDKQR